MWNVKKIVPALMVAVVVVVWALPPGIAVAQSPPARPTARLGIQTETSSIDPHFAIVGANQTVSGLIFESLLSADDAMRPKAGVADRWEAVSDTIWEFHVRPGAVFHDGSPVTAEDIRFSLERMPHVPGSPAPFVRLAGLTQRLEVVSPEVFRLHTKGFDPSVPLHALGAYIVSARATAGANSSDFNAGRAAIGSGPWRFVEFKPGERLVLEAARPDLAYGRAIIRPIGNDAARVAALLSGDVDLIDSVPPDDVEKLRANKAVTIWQAPSARMIYIGLDQEHAVSGQITGMDGKPLGANPLQDLRVRRALNLAVNRPLIVDRILHGAGHATGQLVPEGFVGYDATIKPPAYDLAAAKRLLAEAGYPNGFRITLTSPNNRYVQDDKTAQAVAQMWTRAGVATSVDVLPANAFFARAAKREFSAFLIGFGSTAGDSYTGMSQVLHSYDEGKGLGALNRFRFADKAVDEALERSQQARDPDSRAAALREAARIAFTQDYAMVPLHLPDNVWATRAGLTYQPKMSEGALPELLR
jgi:peptide/nickel transport system substrate-binding protein